MAIRWNPDFNKKEHKSEANANAQTILQRAGAKKWVAPVRGRTMRTTSGQSIWQINSKKQAVSRDFVHPGALVKLVGHSRKIHSAPYCTVVSESSEGTWGWHESVTYGKWWDCILPDGQTLSINSSDMRPIEVQNGNLPSMEDEEET